MPRPGSLRLILAAGGLALALVAAAVWIASTPKADDRPPVAAAPGASPVRPAPASPDDAAAAPREEHPTALGPSEGVATTVVWPVQVELELVRSANAPKAPGLAPLGTGATARLEGSVLGRGATPLAATVEFIGGANAGRVLACNVDGGFGASDLYPGLAMVRVEAPGGLHAVREVRLRQNRDEQLHVGFDLPGEVSGTVLDAEGKPLAGVEVLLDGYPALTGEDGVFYFASMSAGDNLQLVLRKAGYATISDRIAVAAGRRLEAEPRPDGPPVLRQGGGTFGYTLLPAASLEIALGPRVGAVGESQIVILPERLNQKRTFPWHALTPRRALPGTIVRFDDLPAMRVSVRVFHEGAQAEPEQATISLRAGETAHHSVRFTPAPALHGVVVDREGRKLEGARVTCEVPDRVGATIQYMELMPIDMESEIVPALPPAAGTTLTDHDGAFVLSSWPKFGAARYLTAVSADGTLWGGRVVKDAEQVVELVLAPLEERTADLALEFPGRRQGVPVVLTVNGEPRAEQVIAAGEPLLVAGLATGTWRLKASWNGQSLFLGHAQEEFELRENATRTLALPQGAIDGQDEDTRLRAGKL